jgi:uncharacterized protein YfiM (DUF2279 family)
MPRKYHHSGVIAMKMVLALLLVATGVSAADLDWPDDYWQSVTNRIDAIAPSGNAVGLSEALAEFDSRPGVSSGSVLSSGDGAFDSRPFVSGVSNGINMESVLPGLTIVVR